MKTVWHRTRHDAGVGGSDVLRSLLGERAFPFPKSLYAVRDTLAALTGHRKDAVIVDFFAGSGTTAHAAALLNANDYGNRRCILVTNNEVSEEVAAGLNAQNLFVGDDDYEAHGICRSVTIPRIRAAITGRDRDGSPIDGRYLNGKPYAEGFKENAAFFDLVYNDPDIVEVGAHFDLVAPLLWLAAGGLGAPPPRDFPGPWYLPGDAPYAVLFDEDHFKEFLLALCGREDVTHVWLVTDSEGAFARMSVRVPGNRQLGMLYRDYLRNFAVGVGGAR